MRRPFRPPLILLAGAVAACAYYNGLYNANQLAAEARRAEAEGRRGEARSLWLQVAVKAESVIVRFPESNQRDDALLMRGLALSRVGDCREAIATLQEAAAPTSDDRVRTEAYQILGECYFQIDQPVDAWEAFSALVDDPDPAVADRALWWRGRASLARGEPDAALRDLLRTGEPSAVLDRAAALVVLGRSEAATRALDTALALPYDEENWLVVLVRLGDANPEHSTAVVETLVKEDHLTDGERARLLIAEGKRWLPRDAVRANAYLREAAKIAEDSVESGIAEAWIVVGAARRTADLDSVGYLRGRFEGLILEGASVMAIVGPFARILGEVEIALQPSSTGDLLLFREAEQVRDSLDANPLARELFLTVANRYRESAIAPKAVLAAVHIGSPASDSLLNVLLREYPDSPYTQAAYGLPAPRYNVVEDSIRTLLNQVSVSRAERGRDAGDQIWPGTQIPDTNRAVVDRHD